MEQHNPIFSSLQSILQQNNIFHHSNEGITICSVRDQQQGVELAAELLYNTVDTKTVLYLSGGRTPQTLYEKFAAEEQLAPGAVGQVDERFGTPYHANSNQKMIRETGLLRYFEMRDIPFYPMLLPPLAKGVSDRTGDLDPKSPPPPFSKGGNNREGTAQAYDQRVRSLHATFQKSIAVLGIGSDGHTAGLPAAGNSELRTEDKEVYDTYDFVTSYRDMKGTYGERVTMTFLGLSMMDVLLVLVFGEDKKEALQVMFQDGIEQEIPARFYKRPDIAEKTILITDQSI